MKSMPFLQNHAAPRRPVAPCRVLVIVFGIALCSCEGERYNAVPLYPVTGKVVCGEEPAVGAIVRFHPLPLESHDKETLYPTAKVAADGSFALTTYEHQDGAPPGEYAVTIRWPVDPENLQGPPMARPPDRLGEALSEPLQSPYRISITEGENELDPIRVDPSLLTKPGKERRDPFQTGVRPLQSPLTADVWAALVSRAPYLPLPCMAVLATHDLPAVLGEYAASEHKGSVCRSRDVSCVTQTFVSLLIGRDEPCEDDVPLR